MLLDLTSTALRWNRRRQSWRPLAEPFNPGQFGVELIGTVTARDFVATHHYSGSFPVAPWHPSASSSAMGCTKPAS